MDTIKIMIVDDERNVAESIALMLRFEGFTVDIATDKDSTEALMLKNVYDAAIIDLRMPNVSGMEILAMCRETDPAMAALMLTSYGDVDAAREAFKLGVKDFLSKPISSKDLKDALDRALDMSRLARENRRLRDVYKDTAAMGGIIGNDPKFREQVDRALQFADSDLPVLVRGESGTGKELIPLMLHQASSRAKHPFVPIALQQIPKDLQEAALFGYTKGAFTGAVRTHRGCFQEADNGTLFLDEIGDLNVDTQVSLLRVLDSGDFFPINAEHRLRVNVRLITATNADLEKKIETGQFRDELFYRINTATITLPPLRERRGDIPLLAEHFLRLKVGTNRDLPEIDPEAMRLLQEYSWPGNIRELRNVIERAMILAKGNVIRGEDCQISSVGAPKGVGFDHIFDLPLKKAQELFTAEYLKKLSSRFGGDAAKIAKYSGVDASTIRRKKNSLGLSK